MKKFIFWMLFGGFLVGCDAAYAQDRNQSWQFQGQNRASIAALIREVEQGGDSNGTIAGYAAGGYTNLVCGKDGQASAAGNTTCIILNNSDGIVDIGQESNGNQTATDTTSTSENTGADEVLETLAGTAE